MGAAGPAGEAQPASRWRPARPAASPAKQRQSCMQSCMRRGPPPRPLARPRSHPTLAPVPASRREGAGGPILSKRRWLMRGCARSCATQTRCGVGTSIAGPARSACACLGCLWLPVAGGQGGMHAGAVRLPQVCPGCCPEHTLVPCTRRYAPHSSLSGPPHEPCFNAPPFLAGPQDAQAGAAQEGAPAAGARCLLALWIEREPG